jgi:hypothetical protein
MGSIFEYASQFDQRLPSSIDRPVAGVQKVEQLADAAMIIELA